MKEQQRRAGAACYAVDDGTLTLNIESRKAIKHIDANQLTALEKT
ncbi:MAG: hypothetical protein WBP94_13910 [Rhodomicrobiaceae bacterium]